MLFRLLDAKIIGYVKTDTLNKSPLDITYQPGSKLAEMIGDARTLAIIGFSGQTQFPDDSQILIGTESLLQNNLLEVWQSDEPIETGSSRDIRYRKTPSLLFGQVLRNSLDDSIESITQDIYQQINQLQQTLGYHSMIRVWNYLPWINRRDNSMERYQSFCVGRHQAIDTSRGFESHLPAATAVGTHDDGILVYFLAAHEDGVQIENPRQISAFEYPQQYAPKSPTFSRAIVKQWGDSQHLYISGTASILGHKTRHKNKLLEQLDECINNMDILISEARQQTGIEIRDISDLTGLKLYLRQQDDLDAVLAHLRKRAGDQVEILILHADICRDDLMLEIEGFGVR